MHARKYLSNMTLDPYNMELNCRSGSNIQQLLLGISPTLQYGPPADNSSDLLSRSFYSFTAFLVFDSSIDFGDHEWNIGGMKVKTSVTLSKDIVALIDQHAEGENNRSAFIELAIRTYLEILKMKMRDDADLKTINRLSEKLNKEADDVLGYQAKLRD